MTQYDPNAETVEVRTVEPGYTETVTETVVVRESNAGWWIAGVLGALVLLAVLWILFARGGAPATDDALLDARLDAAEAEAQRDAALVQGQVAGAQASVDVARANAVAADAQARAAEARAAEPVIIEREVQVPAPAPTGPAVVSPTAPQN